MQLHTRTRLVYLQVHGQSDFARSHAAVSIVAARGGRTPAAIAGRLAVFVAESISASNAGPPDSRGRR